ncbi:radical SAM protein [Halostella sp. PRR32]|uniref:SPL family radical SAM protein n=1 Tax=Halostella sp. PRR32 TaxID=3098147 RepID=UPI002B1D095D|nr:radical SAM protein [Halostella sp. PRR32]
MELEYRVGDDWFDRSYELVNSEEALESFDDPTLDQLREGSRKHGDSLDRLDLWQAGLLCAECSDAINGRFAASPEGDLLCWECASQTEEQEKSGISVNTDPTKAIISESRLYKKSLCDYVINVATGCRHGCKFCYVPTTPAIENRDEMLNEQAGVEDPQGDWGSYLLYRDDLPERLGNELENTDEDDWETTDRGRGVVMLSSGTDCYQDRRAAQITRGCVAELVKHDRPVRILTRSPAVTRDLDLFKEAGDLVTVGSSIPSLDAPLVRAMEPNAPPPMARWEALDTLSRAGVRVFVSMSPTYPTMDEDDLWELLTYLKALDPEVIFHEPINPRGKNFQMCLEAAEELGDERLAEELQNLQDKDYWVQYALEQISLVQALSDEIGGLQIHSWPDRELLKETLGPLRSRLKEMRRSVSPESFSAEVEETKQKGSMTNIKEFL